MEIKFDPILNLPAELTDLEFHSIRHDIYLDRKARVVELYPNFHSIGGIKYYEKKFFCICSRHKSINGHECKYRGIYDLHNRGGIPSSVFLEVFHAITLRYTLKSINSNGR